IDQLGASVKVTGLRGDLERAGAWPVVLEGPDVVTRLDLGRQREAGVGKAHRRIRLWNPIRLGCGCGGGDGQWMDHSPIEMEQGGLDAAHEYVVSRCEIDDGLRGFARADRPDATCEADDRFCRQVV